MKIIKPILLATLITFTSPPLGVMIKATPAFAYREGDAALNRLLGVNTRVVRWCGLYLAKIVSAPPKFAASVDSWRNWGKRTECRVGTVAIFRHRHVGKVVAVRRGGLLIVSGNDGNAVKTRWRSSRAISHCRAR
jgi:hypothetical protein